MKYTAEELKACIGEGFDISKPFEIKIGNEIFKCYIYQYEQIGVAKGWSLAGKYTMIHVEGSSKRVQEVAEAKALVNKTKEAHKEAQRKLAELQEGKWFHI